MKTVSQSYIDGILEGRASLNAIGGSAASREAIQSMFRSVEAQHARSRGIAYGALADFVEFRRGEMDFWRNQVARLG